MGGGDVKCPQLEWVKCLQLEWVETLGGKNERGGVGGGGVGGGREVMWP